MSEPKTGEITPVSVIPLDIAINNLSLDYKPDHTWDINGSNYRSYEKTFEPLLGGLSFINYIPQKNGVVLLDLMSDTKMLSTLIPNIPAELNPRGFSMSLSDLRSKISLDRDKALDIEHIVGDVNYLKSWDDLKRKLPNGHADFVVERGISGLRQIPGYLEHFRKLMQEVWQITNEEGVIFMQLPYQFNEGSDFDTKIQKFVNRLNTNKIESRYSKSPTTPLLFIRKPLGAPELLTSRLF